MFIPTSVARMPSMRPAEPVITPADRSNSPPIINSATSTAGMPIVDATSVQLAMPSSRRKSAFCDQKKIATTTAASSAPISGRRRIRDARLMFASRSSATGIAGGGAAGDGVGCVVLMALPRAGLRELRDGPGVVLVDEARAGEDGQAAADGVGVVPEELQEHDRQVALEVLLLIDGELDRPGLDVLDHVRADVERRQLRAGARALDRRLGRLADVRVERDHRVKGLVGLELRLDLGLRRGDVRRALDLEVGHVAAEALLDAVAALLEADVVLLVDDAEDLLDSLGLEPLAGRLAGDRLVLADVRDGAERLGIVGARVERDDGDAGGLRLRQRALDRVRVRNRHGEAVDLLGDGGRDQLRLLLRVVVRRAPDQLDALVLRGLLGALLDDRPERALVAVGDHRDREVAALGEVDRLGVVRLRVPVCILVAVAAPGRHERAEREDDQEHAADDWLHGRDTLSLLGAGVDRNSRLRATSSTGPPSTGGSGPVMATSCSSTSQRS